MLSLVLAACLQTQDGSAQGGATDASAERDVRVEVVVESPVALDLAKIERALTSEDLDAREAAFDEVLERAACDEGLQRWLGQVAQATDRIELAWSARMVLREIECQGERVVVSTPPLMLRGALPTISEQVLAEWAEVQKKAERLIGKSGGDLHLVLGLVPARERPVERAFPQADVRQPAMSRQNVQVEAGPQGFRVSVTRQENGGEKTELYEGDSLELLLARHPELGELLGLHSGDGQILGYRVKPQSGFMLGPDRNAVQRTDVLGVQLNVVSPGRAVELGLAPGDGLQVVGMPTPGTIARALGVREGDVILSVGGRAIRDLDDVTKALAGRAERSRLQVLWLDRRGRRQVKSWSPLATAQPEAAPTPRAPR